MENKLASIINVVTKGEISNLPHFCNIINIIYKFRFVENKKDVIFFKIWEYADNNNLGVIDSDYITYLIKILGVLYPNKYKKQYNYSGGKLVEVLPTIVINLDGNFNLGYTQEPNIVFEILDYKISDNYRKIDLRSEFLLYVALFEININNYDVALSSFRKNFEYAISKRRAPMKISISKNIEKFMSNIIISKNLTKSYFNGWTNDLFFIVSDR